MSDKRIKISIFFLALLSLLSVSGVSGQNFDGNPHLRTVVIDPGHGGKDPGAPCPNGKTSEKHIVLKISKLLGEKIRKEYPSVKVAYTRNGDSFLKLTDRVKTAHDNNADLFISIHCNSSKAKSASGSSAHILSRKDSRDPDRDLFDENLELTKLENSVIEFEEDHSSYTDTAEDQILNALLFHANFDHSVMFAQLVVDKLATAPFKKWGKGIHQNDFLLLKKMTCPAILVECAFLSNADERKLLTSDKWLEEIADRLFNAFREYKTIYDASVSSNADYIPQQNASVKDKEPDSQSQNFRSDSYYSVQIMSLSRLLFNNDPILKGVKAKAVRDTDIYRYVSGNFNSREEAAEHQKKLKKDFPEAFIVTVEGNKVKRAH